MADARTSEVEVILNVTAEMRILTTLKKTNRGTSINLRKEINEHSNGDNTSSFMNFTRTQHAIQNAKLQQTHAKFA